MLIKYVIQKSVRQILHTFPNYKLDKIQFVENKQLKKFIEIKGEITVQHKGKVPLFIMYPATFPKTAPYVRIVNPNPQQFAPSNYYLQLKSKSDQMSFILNDVLKEVKGWTPSHSVARIIIEANDLVRTNYPFQFINQIPVQYPPQNQGWNNQGFTNQNFPQNYGQQYYQPPQNNANWPNNFKQPPIPFKTTSNLNQIIIKSQKLVSTQKEKVTVLKNRHTAVLPNIQQLDTINKALESESQLIFIQNQNMSQFLDKSSQSQIRVLSEVVKPKDEVSEHILQLNCSIKARQDTIQMLESKFNEQAISFQDFLKHIRKLQEAKFQEKVLLTKYIEKG